MFFRPQRFVLFDSEPSSSTQVWSGSSSWHLYWKRQLRSSSLEASAILEQSVLEKMGSWVLGVTSRTSEMVFPFAQCAGGRRCSGGWFQCSERFLGSWSSHWGVSWQEWSGQECVHQNEVFHVGASHCEVGYGSWMWWIKCYVFWLCITMTCTIWCTKNIDECYVKSVCGNWLVSVRGRYVSAVYGVNSWGTTIRFMTCRAALQRFRDFTKLSCAAGPRFRKPFLSWRESRALPLKFVQSRYGLGQHCMCNNVVAHLWFWPSFVTVFVVLMLCVKAHSLSNLYSVLLGFMYPVSVYFWVFCRTMKMDI